MLTQLKLRKWIVMSDLTAAEMLATICGVPKHAGWMPAACGLKHDDRDSATLGIYLVIIKDICLCSEGQGYTTWSGREFTPTWRTFLLSTIFFFLSFFLFFFFLFPCFRKIAVILIY